MSYYESAFPRDVRNEYNGEICNQENGMTLRDYFAAKAMQVYLQESFNSVDGDKEIAKASYSTADAMLKAREQ